MYLTQICKVSDRSPNQDYRKCMMKFILLKMVKYMELILEKLDKLQKNNKTNVQNKKNDEVQNNVITCVLQKHAMGRKNKTIKLEYIYDNNDQLMIFSYQRGIYVMLLHSLFYLFLFMYKHIYSFYIISL